MPAGRASSTISSRRETAAGETTGVEERLTDLFRHYDFSYRREFVLRGQRIQDDRIPAATINGAIGGIAWGAWVPENWSQSSRNPAEEMDVALRRGLVSKAGGPLCEPAAGWIDAYLGELIDHAALLGLDQVQSLTWMYCASRAHLANSAAQLPTDHAVRDAGVRLGGHRPPLRRMKGSAFHRRLTERLLPEWAGVNYVQGVGAAQRTPHIWDGDGLKLLTELSDGTTAELTWMLDRNKVRTALNRSAEGSWMASKCPARTGCSRRSQYFAEAERDFGELNTELAAVAWR